MDDRERIMAKVRDLLRLACDPGAREAEARTAAFIACQLIQRHSLLDGAAAQRPRVKLKSMLIYARFASPCLMCRERIAEGEQCRWVKDEGVFHLECFEQIQQQHTG